MILQLSGILHLSILSLAHRERYLHISDDDDDGDDNYWGDLRLQTKGWQWQWQRRPLGARRRLGMHRRVVTVRGRCGACPTSAKTYLLDCFLLDIPEENALVPAHAKESTAPGLGISAGDVGGMKARSLAYPPGPAVGERDVWGSQTSSPPVTPRMRKFNLKVFQYFWTPCPHSWDICSAREGVMGCLPASQEVVEGMDY